MVQDELYGRPIESRIWSIERRAIFNDLELPQTHFKVRPFFDAEYLRSKWLKSKDTAIEGE